MFAGSTAGGMARNSSERSEPRLVQRLRAIRLRHSFTRWLGSARHGPFDRQIHRPQCRDPQRGITIRTRTPTLTAVHVGSDHLKWNLDTITWEGSFCRKAKGRVGEQHKVTNSPAPEMGVNYISVLKCVKIFSRHTPNGDDAKCSLASGLKNAFEFLSKE